MKASSTRSKFNILNVPSNQAKFNRTVTINFLPIFLMVLLIPFIKNDYFLAAIYVVIVVVAFAFHYKKNEFGLLVFGMILMMIVESVFISSGVETFHRNSLFGIMPFWLPLLWGYGFVVLKRLVVILQ